MALILVVIEAALQLASFAGRALLPRGSLEPRADGETVILAVGDSHTFGAPLPADDSYPSQLQSALTRRFPGRSFRVVNLGIPGSNSAFVANRLERQILQLRPHLVILWVGVNNHWNVLETEAWGHADLGTSVRRTLLHSKLFRSAMVAWHTRSHENAPAQRIGPLTEPLEKGANSWRFGEEVVRPEPAGERRPAVENNSGLAFDLERIVSTTRALDTPILFVNYPLDYQGTRETIEQSGERLDVPVIDSRRSMGRAIRDGYTHKELFVFAAGPHPTRLLYRYVVRDLMPYVVASFDPAFQ